MSFKIWGIECNESISDKDKIYLLNLPKDLPRMQWICDELDRVWGSLGLDNKKPPSEHSLIFRRKQYLDLDAALSYLKIIQFVGGALNLIWLIASKAKNMFR